MWDNDNDVPECEEYDPQLEGLLDTLAEMGADDTLPPEMVEEIVFDL